MLEYLYIYIDRNRNICKNKSGTNRRMTFFVVYSIFFYFIFIFWLAKEYLYGIVQEYNNVNIRCCHMFKKRN